MKCISDRGGEKERQGWLTYRELADELPAYAVNLGFTHIEFIPIMEHPFDGSWGYQPISLYAPTVGLVHRPILRRWWMHAIAGLPVILDWVAGHFPDDLHGLATFDGTALYEHVDPKQGRHLDWNTLIYNFGRRVVVNF